MLVHILGVAHSITAVSPKFHPNPTDAFATLTSYLAKLLHRAGYTVYVYAVEGSEVEECTEVVPVVSASTYHKVYGERDDRLVNSYSDSENEAWSEFTTNAIAEVLKRRRGRDDIVCAMLGWAHEPTTTALKHCLPAIVEPTIGHPGSYSDFRVFCSYAWFYSECARQGDTHPSDYYCVIPHFLDKDHYPPKATSPIEPYAVYVGRVQFDKGLSAAVECTRVMKIKLVVVGNGHLPEAAPGCDLSHVQCVGVLPLVPKRELLAGACCCFALSRYCEPWSLAALEAQFCGTPVLCSKFGGFTEFVVHGKTGFHCDTLGTVCHYFAQCTALNREEIRRHATQRYSIEAVSPMFLQYFDRVRNYAMGHWDWYSLEDRNTPGLRLLPPPPRGTGSWS